SSRLILMTAHRAADAEAIDWSGLTHTDATLAIYMGRATAPIVAEGLIAAGRDPKTPAVVLSRGTRRDSTSVAGTLDELPALVARAGKGPALLVLGQVVRRSRPWRQRIGDAIAEMSGRNARPKEVV